MPPLRQNGTWKGSDGSAAEREKRLERVAAVSRCRGAQSTKADGGHRNRTAVPYGTPVILSGQSGAQREKAFPLFSFSCLKFLPDFFQKAAKVPLQRVPTKEQTVCGCRRFGLITPMQDPPGSRKARGRRCLRRGRHRGRDWFRSFPGRC